MHFLTIHTGGAKDQTTYLWLVDVSKYLLSPGAALNMDENNAGGAGSHKTGKTDRKRHKRRQSEEWWRQEGKVQTDLWATETTSINQEDEGRNTQTLDTLQTQEATTIKSKQEPKLRKTDPIWGCILVSQFPSSSSWCDEHSLESWMSAKSSQTHTAVHKKSCQSCSVWLNRLCFSTILR